MTKQEFLGRLQDDPFGRGYLPSNLEVYRERLWVYYQSGLQDGRLEAVDKLAQHLKQLLEE